jgi:hypothetical protein
VILGSGETQTWERRFLFCVCCGVVWWVDVRRYPYGDRAPMLSCVGVTARRRTHDDGPLLAVAEVRSI